MTYRVAMTLSVKRRVLEQARYIAEQGGSPQNADAWLARVFDSFHALEEFPRWCPLAVESELCGDEIRVLNIDGFLLLFEIDDDARVVRTVSARHGVQMPEEPS